MKESDIQRYLNPGIYEKTQKVGTVVDHLKGVLEDPNYSSDYKKAAEDVAKETLVNIANNKL